MDPEYDEDLGLEPEQQPQATGFEGLPPETQAEIRKLRKENQKLREDRGTTQKELLTAKYGEDVVELIPPEVTDYARQTELAEKFKERFATPSSTEAQAEAEEVEAVTEPPTTTEQTLAIATGGPATGTTGAGDADAARERIIELAKQATI